MINRALKLIRKYHNLTLDELAIEADLSKSYISEIERGNKTPSIGTLQKYAEVFDMPLSSIMFFAENQEESKSTGKIRRSIAKKALTLLEWVEEIS